MPNCDWFLGDYGYPLKPWPLTPVLNPNSRGEKNIMIVSKTRVAGEIQLGLEEKGFGELTKEAAHCNINQANASIS